MSGRAEISPRETRLVAAAQTGDAAAFTQLVRSSAPALERLALRLIGHRHDAEDIAQDAVLAAWNKLGTFRGKARFQTWICRILVRRALDLLRRRHRLSAVTDVAASGTDPVVHAQEHELEGIVRTAIEQLPPVQRATILLRADQGLSYEEIAYVLGSTRNAVRSNLIAARKHLAKALQGRVDL